MFLLAMLLMAGGMFLIEATDDPLPTAGAGMLCGAALIFAATSGKDNRR